MFGIRYAKFTPGTYVFRHKNGMLAQEGDGLSFYYYSPNTSIVAIHTGSSDAHFMFSEVTVDFQEITIQGQLTYKISEPHKTVQMLNYAVNNASLRYISDDPQMLPERLINLAQVATKSAVKSLSLKQAVASSSDIAEHIFNTLNGHNMVEALGVSVLSVTVAAVKPNAETARALEATTREQILKESDDAVFMRRNAAVEQERAIRENELNTEIAVENKNREIREKQMESQRLVQLKKQELDAEALDFEIQQEERNKNLVELKTLNERREADARAYEVSVLLKAYTGVDPQLVQMLANSNMGANRLMALAFQGIADKADKIGHLNITPDLLNNIIERDDE